MKDGRTEPRGAVALHEKANWNPWWRVEKYEEDAAYREFQARQLATVQRLEQDQGFMQRVQAHRDRLVAEKLRYIQLRVQEAKMRADLAFYRSRDGLVAVAKALLPLDLRLDNTHRLAFAVDTFQHNLLANAGINELWSLVAGSGGVQYDNSNAYLGAGNDNTAAAAGQTDLIGTNTRIGMEGGYPTYGTSQKATWQSSFGGAEGNHAWTEFGTFNHASAGDMLNRKVEDEGTKTSGQTWVLTLDITLS